MFLFCNNLSKIVVSQIFFYLRSLLNVFLIDVSCINAFLAHDDYIVFGEKHFSATRTDFNGPASWENILKTNSILTDMMQ